MDDPIPELDVAYVEQMGVRSAVSIEARLMRDWLRMHREIEDLRKRISARRPA